MNTAAVVKRWRARAGLSQEALALRIRSHQANIARIEQGIQTPRVDTFARILDACGAELIVEPRRDLPLVRTPVEAVEPPHGQLLGVLRIRKVRYVLVGPVAERLRGSDVPMEPPEIVAEGWWLNHLRLARAGDALRRIRGRKPTPPFTLSFEPPRPYGSYEELAASATPVGPGDIPVPRLDDLIEMRRTPRSREDRDALDRLLALRRCRDQR